MQFTYDPCLPPRGKVSCGTQDGRGVQAYASARVPSPVTLSEATNET